MINRILTVGLLLFLSSIFVFSNPKKDILQDESTGVILHEYPRICPQSDLYKVNIDGQNAFVYDATKASFVSLENNRSVEVEIHVNKPFHSVRILPLNLGIKPKIDGQIIKFSLPPAAKVYVESDLDEHLFIYGNAIETNKPDPNDPKVKYFKAGQVYEVAELVLENNETIYIEGGAVIRGQIRATRANNIKIDGLGVLDGSFYKNQFDLRPRTVLIEDSRDINIKGLIIIESQMWVVTLYYSEGVNIDNIKEISYGGGTDGIDIMSCKKVHINNSILRNGDDVIVIKAHKDLYKKYSEIVQNKHLVGVEDILVTGCSLQTNLGGHVFEIGHELIENPIHNIRFVDCDVLGAHDHGGVFGLHNADGAHISNIVFENIRVDHYYNKLIDMRIIKSRFSSEEKIGTADHILFKDININASRYNQGYSISLIGGYDKDHKISNITFDNFRINGEKVTNVDQLELFTKHIENLEFK